MWILSLIIVFFALGLFLSLSGVYLPVDRDGRRLAEWSNRDAAVPIPVFADRSGTARPSGEVNPPATLRSV